MPRIISAALLLAVSLAGFGCSSTPRHIETPLSCDSAAPGPVSMLGTTWQLLNAVDEKGHMWNQSTLEFVNEQPAVNGLRLEGFFNWRSAGVRRGKEHVVGSIDFDTGRLKLRGDYIQNRRNISEANYTAVLCGDRKTISHGRWFAPGVASGKWSASLASRVDRMSRGN